MGQDGDSPFIGVYRDRSVLVTGHTGFKGSWLSTWLLELGAEVTGLALDPPTDPSAFDLCGLADRMRHVVGDVRDAARVAAIVDGARPDFVFHMAAQAIVRRAYASPVETFGTNVMGTVNVLEAVRRLQRSCVVVVVTSDKCYRNDGEPKEFTESDALGARDPYGASKGCAEFVVSSYRRSYFPVVEYSEHGVAIASARAGNVIGGGDWAPDRLVPDIVRALCSRVPAKIRRPDGVRPWQHVLDPLAGYLWLAAKMSAEGAEGLAEAWNFGPSRENAVTVRELADRVIRSWGEGRWEAVPERGAPPEAAFLGLSCDKAARTLEWRPVYGLDDAVRATVSWHRHALDGGDMFACTVGQIHEYMERARATGVAWVGARSP